MSIKRWNVNSKILLDKPLNSLKNIQLILSKLPQTMNYNIYIYILLFYFILVKSFHPIQELR